MRIHNVAKNRQRKVKPLPQDKARDLEEFNQCRGEVGLPKLKIKVVECRYCGELFETFEGKLDCSRKCNKDFLDSVHLEC